MLLVTEHPLEEEMSPINLTDTNDPHHSLLLKPNKATAKDEELLEEYEKQKEKQIALDNESKKGSEKIYWWGKSRE